MDPAIVLELIKGLHSSQISTKVKVEPFNGDDNVNEFIRKYEDLTRTLDEKQQALSVTNYLSGTARRWYERKYNGNYNNVTWVNIKNDLLARYGSYDARTSAIRKLKSMSWQEGVQKLSTYVDDYIYYYEKATPTADVESKIAAVHESLPEHIREKFMSMGKAAHTLKDLEEYTQLIKQLEEILWFANKTRKSSSQAEVLGHETKRVMYAIKARNYKQESAAAGLENVEQEPEAPKKNRRYTFDKRASKDNTEVKEKKKLECFVCGEDHYASKCPKKWSGRSE